MGPAAPAAPAPPLALVACGAVNGLGFDAHQTWAFWRAEASPIAESPFRDGAGERASMIAARTLPPRLQGGRRLALLGSEALAQLEPALAALKPERVALLASISERHAGGAEPGGGRTELEATWGRWLEALAGQAAARVLPRGQGGFAAALQEAGAALAHGSVDAVIVGGADSYWDGGVVQELIEEERLFTGENLDGFIPGEGAAFALLTLDAAARQARLPVKLRVLAAALERETAPGHGSAPARAEALGRALRTAAAAVRARDAARVDWLLGDVTNEGWRAHELQLALPRALAPGGLDGGKGYRELVKPGARVDMLPLRFGALGAATLPTALVVASEAFARGDPVATHCLAFASSLGPARSALLLAPGTSRERRGAAAGPRQAGGGG